MAEPCDPETPAAAVATVPRPPTPAPVSLAPGRWSGAEWVLAVFWVIAVFAAYWPARQGGFIWDDDLHLLNNPVLRPGGLFRAWLPGSYVFYWPLTSTAYWVEYQLWGLSPLGFHLVNIALHALSAVLIWRLLRVAARAGRGVRGSSVCAAPGQRRERGLDRATEKHPFVGADAALRAPVFALRAAGRSACRAGLLGATTWLRQVPPGRRDLRRRDLPPAAGGCISRRWPCSPWRRWPKA